MRFGTMGNSSKRYRGLVRATKSICEPLEDRLLLSRTIYVDAGVSGPTHDGTAWNSAYTDLQLALAAALSGDTIKVAAGTYKPTSGTSRMATFQLKTGVEMLGGYAGSSGADPDARNVTIWETVLSGNIGSGGSNSDNSYHVVTASGVDATATLDGLTIAAGTANGASSAGNGGGLYVTGGNPTIRGCLFTNNFASWYGGGIYNTSSSPSVIRCTFIRNQATYGGGIYNSSSSAPTFLSCEFDGNAASIAGGGIYNIDSSVQTLLNCSFAGNLASGPRGGVNASGGAIYNASSAITLTNCTFVGNSATDDGGVMYSLGTPPVSVNCIFWENGVSRGPQILQSELGWIPVITYSDIDGGWTGVGNIQVDPLFVRNPSPGADGQWGTIDDDYGDLHIPAYSPAVDAGANAAVPPETASDLAGEPRFLDVPTAPEVGLGAGPLVDMGAYEAIPELAADAGGPYRVLQGQEISLAGRGASDMPGELQYAWDFDEDGIFNDAVGTNPVFPSAGISAPSTISISLRVTDAASSSVICTTTLAVLSAVAYVDLHAMGSGTGTSWADASTNLASAIENALPGQEIHVAAGTYVPTLTSSRAATFQLRSGVSLMGGYAGSGADNPDARDVIAWSTVLSGDIGVSDDSSDNCFHVVTGTGTDASAMLDGFTISGGSASGTGEARYGGGFYTINGSATFRNCTFSGNTASYYGGGIYASASSLTLINCIVVGNASSYRGGGIYIDSSSLAITNCTIAGNRATDGGGGICASRSSTAIHNSILWANIAVANSQLYRLYLLDGSLKVNYTDIQDGWTGTGNLNTDPRFARNPSPGPDSVWGTSDDDYGDLRLPAYSPIVDAGNNSLVPAGTATDLAGNARFMDIATTEDIGVGAALIVDMGAFEAIPALAADAGGPYIVVFGQSLTLRGRGASDVPGDLVYTWDLDQDGQFDDATGPDPILSTDETIAPATLLVSLRVTDVQSRSVTSMPVTIRVLPVAVCVDALATGDGDGTSWGTAYSDLQTALRNALPGQELHVAGGLYKPTATSDRTLSFQLKSGVILLGGYAGSGSADPDTRNITAYPSILSGDIGIINSAIDNSFHVLTGNGADATSILDGFTITDGNAGLATGDGYGGGMYLSLGSPTIRNCTFAGNLARYGGGAILLLGCAPAFINCVFVANSSDRGGAIYCSGTAAPVLTNCTLSGNAATHYGGALCNENSARPTLTNSILWLNNAPEGTEFSGGTATVTFSDLESGWEGTGNIDADPLFVRNPSAGGDGKWGTADDDYGDLRLSAGSPCIDSGSNPAVPADITTDAAGNPRIVDVPGWRDPGAIVDMGAYERIPVAVSLPSDSGQLYVGLAPDGTTLQVFTGTLPAGTPVASYNAREVDLLNLELGSESDSVIVDFSNGQPTGLSLVTADGDDQLILTGTTGQAIDIRPDMVAVDGEDILLGAGCAVILDAPTDGTVNAGSLSITSGLALAPGKNLTLRAGSLEISESGSLDLDGGSLIIDYTDASPLPQVRLWIQNGQLGTAASLTTSADQALGFTDNALLHRTAFGGHALAAPFSQVLIQTTSPGDTNLDGRVDQRDYLNILANMGLDSAHWLLGDLNNDGIVSVDDLAEVTAHLASSGAPSLLSLAAPSKTSSNVAASKSDATQIATGSPGSAPSESIVPLMPATALELPPTTGIEPLTPRTPATALAVPRVAIGQPSHAISPLWSPVAGLFDEVDARPFAISRAARKPGLNVAPTA